MGKAIAIFALLLLAAVAFARETESLDQLKARAESANPSDQLKLTLAIAKRQLRAADGYYKQGEIAKAELAIADVASYGEKASAAACKTQKRLKHTEIDLRNMERRLQGIRLAVDSNNRPVLQSAIDRLEKARAALVWAMFGPPETGDMQEAAGSK